MRVRSRLKNTFHKSGSEEAPNNLEDNRIESTKLLLHSVTHNFEAGPLSVPNRLVSTTQGLTVRLFLQKSVNSVESFIPCLGVSPVTMTLVDLCTMSLFSFTNF